MQQLDLRTYACPLPLIIVLLTDPGSRQDIPKFLISLGNKVVELENNALILRIQITKLTQHLSLTQLST